MTSVTYRTIAASPEQLFAVLADGWLYAMWVPGASRMRDVEQSWPSAGAVLHHSFGLWPIVIDDTTTLEEWDPPRHMRLRARGWPVLGEALVSIDVKRRRDGCVVRITEDAIEGPAMAVPEVIRAVGLHVRNTETLRRLAWLAEGGARPARPSVEG
jgi:hypothetical protein